MYIRKSEEEISEINRNDFKKALNPKKLLFIPFGTFPITYFFSAFIGSRTHLPSGLTFLTFERSIIGSIIIFLLTYILQIIKKKYIFDDEYYICNKCNQFYNTYSKKCKCGGKLEDSNYYTQVSDDKQS